VTFLDLFLFWIPQLRRPKRESNGEKVQKGSTANVNWEVLSEYCF
jgi:hypothetical protein